MDKPIFLCDMDDTLFAWSGAIIKRLNEIRHHAEKKFTPENWRDRLSVPYNKARVELIKSQPNFYLDLPIINEGLAVWEAARSIGYDCQILTKGPYFQSQGWTQKYDCIRRHLGADVNVHIVMDKALVYGAVLYDDSVDYLRRWLVRRPRGLGIMPDQPNNREFSHPQVLRHKDNLQEIYSALETEYKRRIDAN